MSEIDLMLRFGIAIAIGVLLGLERERRLGEEAGAGVRTFGLIALAGAMAGYLDFELGLDGFALALFAAVVVLVLALYVMTAWRGDPGITTEVSALMCFVLGLLCARGFVQIAAVIAVAMALLLALRTWLHELARRIEATDVEATLKFAIVTLIILPLVPDQSYGPEPLDVLNPHKIWLMVVLISGLNFAAYLLVKVVGTEHGIGIAGLLGGLVSSTAVTLGYAQRSRQAGEDGAALAFGIMLAWSVMFLRVVVMAWIVTPALAMRLAPAMGGMLVLSLASCWWARRRGAQQRGTVEAGKNPFELDMAIKFGLVFGVVVFVARAAEVYLGEYGLYLAAAIAGLTDVDAITLAMADLVQKSMQEIDIAVRAVVVAVAANTFVKSAMAISMGSAELRRIVLPAAALLFAGGAIAALVT